MAMMKIKFPAYYYISAIIGEMKLKQYVLNVFQNILKDVKRNPREAAFIVKFGIGMKRSERRRKYYRENGEEVPKVLIGSLDSNCNYFCRGCYKRNNKKIIEGQGNSLSISQFKKIIGRAKELGVVSFVFAGGEPLKRKDILQEASKVKSIIFPAVISISSISNDDIKFFNENRNIVPIIRLKGNEAGEAEKFVKLAKSLFNKQVYYGVLLSVNKKNMERAVSTDFVDSLYRNGCKALLFAENVTESIIDNTDREFLKKKEKILRKSYENIFFYYINENDKKVNRCLGFDKEVLQINYKGTMNKCIYIK